VRAGIHRESPANDTGTVTELLGNGS
jgi:hypothetical protein